MIRFRPFKNSDPPALAEIWRSQAASRGLSQPMSAMLWEHEVLAKPYFDRQGLIVALDDGVPVGFVHAAFGPNHDRSGLSTEAGVTCLLMVKPERWQTRLPADLLAQSETYLRGRGAKVLYAGGSRFLNPFYLGLYGGAELQGVLDAESAAQQLYRDSGYVEAERYRVFHLELDRFRPAVSRQQMQVQRRSMVAVTEDPPARSWWEACTWGGLAHTQFQLQLRDGGPSPASVTFWSMESLSRNWGLPAVGLIDLQVAESQRRQGLATCLVSEGCRRMQALGFSLVVAQARHTDTATIGFLQRMGFVEGDGGILFRKDV